MSKEHKPKQTRFEINDICLVPGVNPFADDNESKLDSSGHLSHDCLRLEDTLDGGHFKVVHFLYLSSTDPVTRIFLNATKLYTTHNASLTLLNILQPLLNLEQIFKGHHHYLEWLFM